MCQAYDARPARPRVLSYARPADNLSTLFAPRTGIPTGGVHERRRWGLWALCGGLAGVQTGSKRRVELRGVRHLIPLAHHLES